MNVDIEVRNFIKNNWKKVTKKKQLIKEHILTLIEK